MAEYHDYGAAADAFKTTNELFWISQGALYLVICSPGAWSEIFTASNDPFHATCKEDITLLQGSRICVAVNLVVDHDVMSGLLRRTRGYLSTSSRLCWLFEI